MPRRRLLLVFIALVALLAGACGDDRKQDEPRVLKIGVIAPLDGGLVDFGRGIRNSVQLAVDQANQRNAIPGWRIEVDAATTPPTRPRARPPPSVWPPTLR